MKNCTFLILTVFLISSCSRSRYLTADYAKYGDKHNLIAVLPYDINLRGRLAAEMDESELNAIRTEESKLFQLSLYTEVLERSGVSNNDIKISVQPISKTNRLLSDAGIEITEISEYSPAQLGEVLGVDALLSTRLVKEMFLSRQEAVLVDVASDVVTDILTKRLPTNDNRAKYASKSKLTRTSEVDIYATILDTGSEAVIWAYNTDCDIQWEMDIDDTIENINARISRKLPYRK